VPGDAPSQVSRWAAEAVAKAGSIGIIGVYPQTISTYPIGVVMNKNLTVQAGNCNHRRYMPDLLRLVTERGADPALLLTEPGTDDRRDGRLPRVRSTSTGLAQSRPQPGRLKISLMPNDLGTN
jgi:threonine dehydrogenase-like Zn-dependent dehydrogenase